VCLRVRLRGNNLHILCESRQSLEPQAVVNRFIKALKAQEGEDSFPIDPENPVYQIVIYGRIVGQQRPDWIKQIRIKSYPNPEHQASRTAPGNSILKTPHPMSVTQFLMKVWRVQAHPKRSLVI
jgi:hypothetical protein